MNFLKWKLHYNTACAENTEKRLKSQAKRHSIITKFHKIKRFNHTKISTSAIFFYPHQNFVDLHDPQDSCQSFIRATNTTQASHAI